MAAANAYIQMFVHVCRTGQSMVHVVIIIVRLALVTIQIYMSWTWIVMKILNF